MAETPNEITVKVVLSEESRIALAELVGFGTVGTMLDAVCDILGELDREMTDQLRDFSNKVFERFSAAEAALFNEVGFTT